jgi:ATP-dependent protease ClpP protease subunit
MISEKNKYHDSEHGFSKFKSIFLYSSVSSNISDYMCVIDTLENANKDTLIEMYISTHGGSIQSGFFILDAMKNSEGTIRTHNNTIAASMGAILWSAGDILKCSDYSILMFHGVQSMAIGNTRNHINHTKYIEDIDYSILKEIKDKNIITDEEYESIINGNDLYMVGYEVKERINII